MVVEPHTKRVLWVGRSRSRESVRPFSDLLVPERCKEITAVAMDRHVTEQERPDLNLIEQVFAKLKGILRTVAARSNAPITSEMRAAPLKPEPP